MYLALVKQVVNQDYCSLPFFCKFTYKILTSRFPLHYYVIAEYLEIYSY